MKIEDVFDGPSVSIEQVLKSRSATAERQRYLLQKHKGCLVSFGLNIPGNIKQFSLARCIFAEGMDALRKQFFSEVVYVEAFESAAGSKVFLLISEEIERVKRNCVLIEDSHPLGRLFDFDVICADGSPFSRQQIGVLPRKCMLCGQTAKICARSQAHSIEELRETISRLINDYFCSKGSELCQKNALRAMLYEVSITPKPGLVDRKNSGSHQDMDFFTFIDSSISLTPWVKKFYQIGWRESDENTEELFEHLRAAGKQAEMAMFDTTSGINTHKGLLFSLAVICGAMGAKHFFIEDTANLDEVLALAGMIGSSALYDFEKSDNPSNGKRCYDEYNIAGIRGEAAAGFPSVKQIGLPTLRHEISKGRTINDSAVVTLLALIAGVDDTNMIRRGGYHQAALRKQEAGILLLNIQRGMEDVESVSKMDAEYISLMLSPGGCADLLALSLFLLFADHERKA